MLKGWLYPIFAFEWQRIERIPSLLSMTQLNTYLSAHTNPASAYNCMHNVYNPWYISIAGVTECPVSRSLRQDCDTMV